MYACESSPGTKKKSIFWTKNTFSSQAQETPLHIAARIKDGEKCAEMLLKSGADANSTKEVCTEFPLKVNQCFKNQIAPHTAKEM